MQKLLSTKIQTHLFPKEHGYSPKQLKLFPPMHMVAPWGNISSFFPRGMIVSQGKKKLKLLPEAT
jgi:hypothetical protein